MKNKYIHEDFFETGTKKTLEIVEETLNKFSEHYKNRVGFELCASSSDCNNCIFYKFNEKHFSNCSTFYNRLMKVFGYDKEKNNEYELLMKLKEVLEHETKLSTCDIAPAKETEDKSTVQTRTGHYKQGIQPFDLMKANGIFEDFAKGNIIKYTARMDKKGSKREDLLKVIDYAISLGQHLGIGKEEVLDMLEDRYNG